MLGLPADTILHALSAYPIIEGVVALLIFIFGLRAMREGKKDGPQPVPSYQSHEFPAWLMTGPVYDAFNALHDIKRNSIRQIELLTQIERENHYQTQLLEDIRNENVINPRRLQE